MANNRSIVIPAQAGNFFFLGAPLQKIPAAAAAAFAGMT
jgi:hypothetical protein